MEQKKPSTNEKATTKWEELFANCVSDKLSAAVVDGGELVHGAAA